MSIEKVAAMVTIMLGLVSLLVLSIRSSSRVAVRLAVLETQIIRLMDDLQELRAHLKIRNQLTEDVRELRTAWLSPARARTPREGDGELLT